MWQPPGPWPGPFFHQGNQAPYYPYQHPPVGTNQQAPWPFPQKNSPFQQAPGPFLNQSKPMDLGTMMKNVDQVVKTVNQISPMVKQLSPFLSLFKK